MGQYLLTHISFSKKILLNLQSMLFIIANATDEKSATICIDCVIF